MSSISNLGGHESREIGVKIFHHDFYAYTLRMAFEIDKRNALLKFLLKARSFLVYLQRGECALTLV